MNAIAHPVSGRVMSVVRRLPLIAVIVALLASAAYGQVRVRVYPDEIFDDILLLRDIIDAFNHRVSVDAPDALVDRYPGRTFADFDRDRNSRFHEAGGPIQDAVYDTDLAIMQFIHDDFDIDEDGVIERTREGRRNHYTIHEQLPLRHPVEQHCSVGDLIRMFKQKLTGAPIE